MSAPLRPALRRRHRPGPAEAGDVLPLRVTGIRISQERVQRLVVVGHLLAAVLQRDNTKRAADARRDAQASGRRLQRHPGIGAEIGAGARVRRVCREDVQRLRACVRE